MAEYIYENDRGDWVSCGFYDFARRAILEDLGWVLVEVVEEDVQPDVLAADSEPTEFAEAEAEPAADAE